MTVQDFPACAGWYVPDATCDGDGGAEAPCKFVERCKTLRALAGGDGATEEAIRSVVAKAKAKAVSRPKGQREWRGRTVEVNDPPEQFATAFAICSTVGDRFARAIGARFVQEGEGLRAGDVYLRALPGNGGVQVVLYHFTGKGPRGRWIARVKLRSKSAQFAINCNRDDRSEVWATPAGLVYRSWQDTRRWISVSGVREIHAAEMGRYLATLFAAGLIGEQL